jgi:hypothetical protein
MLRILGSMASVFVVAACSEGGRSSTTNALTDGNARLLAVHYGRLADVFGLRRDGAVTSIELYRKDVLIGPDVRDERDATSNRRDEEITYDFLGADPESLQLRLLITRELGSSGFEEAFADLERHQRQVAPALFGGDTTRTPFSVVPRNAALRLTFSQPLGIDDDFFVTRDAQGFVTGVRNTEAIQLLEIVGDPRDPHPTGDFRAIPARITVRGHQVIVDPVLLGSEGTRYQTRNNAAGLPEAPDQIGANIRLAVALDGPLRIRGIHEQPGSAFIGLNNSQWPSVVRDFRSGNRNDSSPDLARGFIRDPEPPRLLGELLFLLAAVDDDGPTRQVVTIYKNGIEHEFDRGDVVRVLDRRTQGVLGATEILVEPGDDEGAPATQYVRGVVRRLPGLAALDPRQHPAYPSSPNEREPWLREHAPQVVLVAEFTPRRRHPRTQAVYGDDPRYFVTFTPAPLPRDTGEPSAPTENVSPFAGALLRFTKPIDLATARPLDTFFCATRNVLDDDVIRSEFVVPRRIDPARFDKAKFATPHLVAGRIIDEDGSQTSLRLQPSMGLFLNHAMRIPSADAATGAVPFPYFVHLVGGKEGILGLSGQPLDVATTSAIGTTLVIPFTLDTRTRADGSPLFPDNLVVHVARRFASDDEDEQPSLYRADESPVLGAPPAVESTSLPDLFGGLVEDGALKARPTARVRNAVDSFSQGRWPTAMGETNCPSNMTGQPTALARFNFPLQNPLNPFGSRFQTVWREIDMSLSRTDPQDFDLDVEQLYWAPFQGGTLTYDEFDRMSLFLGHSERRPENCWTGAGPQFTMSGLLTRFADNYAADLDLTGRVKTFNPPPHPAYVDQRLFVDPSQVVNGPSGQSRYLMLPRFQQPYFVWRDQTNPVQGGDSDAGSDVRNATRTFEPYIRSPFLGGIGRRFERRPNGVIAETRGYWDNARQYQLLQTSRRELISGGGAGSIALPLLADFMMYCDDPTLPIGYPFLATGWNGWQISIAIPNFSQPDFRVFSGGFSGAGGQKPVCVDPSLPTWTTAAGGYTPTGGRTPSGDNSVFWIMADFVKRQTVVTAGFVDLLDPHRMPNAVVGLADPRLGPYYPASGPPKGVVPRFDWLVDPPLDALPAGTSVRIDFRAAGAIDSVPWRGTVLRVTPLPDAVNFPLDPYKAGDAHIRKFDDRLAPAGVTRNHWTSFYCRNMTDFTPAIADLVDPDFLRGFAGNADAFGPDDVRYINWRFVMQNNVNAVPAVSPALESFALTYRFEPR